MRTHCWAKFPDCCWSNLCYVCQMLLLKSPWTLELRLCEHGSSEGMLCFGENPLRAAPLTGPALSPPPTVYSILTSGTSPCFHTSGLALIPQLGIYTLGWKVARSHTIVRLWVFNGSFVHPASLSPKRPFRKSRLRPPLDHTNPLSQPSDPTLLLWTWDLCNFTRDPKIEQRLEADNV